MSEQPEIRPTTAADGMEWCSSECPQVRIEQSGGEPIEMCGFMGEATDTDGGTCYPAVRRMAQRLEAWRGLLAEAVEYCEQCRELKRDDPRRCARCLTFVAELDKESPHE